MMKIVNESHPLDPFRGLKKVTVGSSDPMPEGCVTDGEGNVYEIPNSGYSKPVVIDSHTKVVYDFGSKELCYVLDGRIVDRTSCSAGSWFDSPEYTAQNYLDRISEDAESEVQYDDPGPADVDSDE